MARVLPTQEAFKLLCEITVESSSVATLGPEAVWHPSVLPEVVEATARAIGAHNVKFWLLLQRKQINTSLVLAALKIFVAFA